MRLVLEHDGRKVTVREEVSASEIADGDLRQGLVLLDDIWFAIGEVNRGLLTASPFFEEGDLL